MSLVSAGVVGEIKERINVFEVTVHITVEYEMCIRDSSIYAGPIFITRDDGVGGLCSLTDEQVVKYSEMFAEPHDISPEETQADVGFTFYGW